MGKKTSAVFMSFCLANDRNRRRAATILGASPPRKPPAMVVTLVISTQISIEFGGRHAGFEWTWPASSRRLVRRKLPSERAGSAVPHFLESSRRIVRSSADILTRWKKVGPLPVRATRKQAIAYLLVARFQLTGFSLRGSLGSHLLPSASCLSMPTT